MQVGRKFLLVTVFPPDLDQAGLIANTCRLNDFGHFYELDPAVLSIAASGILGATLSGKLAILPSMLAVRVPQPAVHRLLPRKFHSYS
jgi:hypothetical protein